MRKVNLLIAFCALLISFSCSNQNTIEVEFSNLTNDSIIVETLALSKYRIERALPEKETLLATNGKLVYQYDFKEPYMVRIKPKQSEISLWGRANVPEEHTVLLICIPGESYKVNVKNGEKFSSFSIEGDPLNTDLAKVTNSFLTELSNATKIYMKMDSLQKSGADRNAMMKVYQGAKAEFQAVTDKKLEYAKNNLDKDLAVMFLMEQRTATYAEFVPQLSEQVQNGILKSHVQYMKDSVKKREISENAKKTVVEGANAPDFTLKTNEDKDFSLSSLKGDKYIVLDFWGSWCGWCIKGFPKMKEYEEKYHDKMIVVGIACNDTKEAWLKAIEKHELKPVQVINGTKLESDVSAKFGITGYPTKFILDKDLKIVAKIVGERPEFYSKLDELMK
jgi:thiol-disulfide isomerase/thioredoxin